jgi:hypothetical protein
MISKSDIRGLADGFAPEVIAEIDKAVAPLRKHIEHLQRRVVMLEINQRGMVAREMVRSHEEIADD